MSSIVHGIQSLIQGVVNVILSLFQGVFGIFQAAFGVVHGVINTALHIISGTISTALHIITGTLQSVADLIGGTVGFVSVRQFYSLQMFGHSQGYFLQGNLVGILVLVAGYFIYTNYYGANANTRNRKFKTS